MPNTISVPPKSLNAALAHVRAGGRLAVPTAWRCTIIDAKCLRKFEKSGEWLLKEEGDGYRMRQGRGSVYLFSGHLQFA